MNNKGCYNCGKEILERPRGLFKCFKGQSNSLGERVVPNKDYTCVDVHISNGKDTVAYATPVCVGCCRTLTSSGSNQDEFFGKVISEIRKHNFGPKYITNEKANLVGIYDLTNELKENRVI